MKLLSHVWLFETLCAVACQAPPSMGFSKQEYWSGCHFLLQGTFPTWGSNPGLPHCRQTSYCLSHQRSPDIVEFLLILNWRGDSIHWLSELWLFSSVCETDIFGNDQKYLSDGIKHFQGLTLARVFGVRGHETAYYYQNAPVFKLHAKVASGNITHPKQQVKLSQR